MGAAIPMLAIAIGGQRLGSGMKVVRTHAAAARKVAGVVVGVTALAIAFGVDQRFTTAVPGYTAALQNRIEESSTARTELDKLSGQGGGGRAGRARAGAPDFRGIDLWLNTPNGAPLSLAELRGRVVLVDFWTYSCINCLRTLPHLEAWDRAYRKAGLTIVGVHSPEFAFERVPDNVRSAVKRLGVRYPVALDNDFATWRAYSNDYWPAEYLIDRSGRIRHEHYGEGSYGETESAIRGCSERRRASRAHRSRTRRRRSSRRPSPTSAMSASIASRAGSRSSTRSRDYRFPQRLRQDELAYAGRWTVEPSRIVAGANARLRLRFQARNVFLVLAGNGQVRVLRRRTPPRTVPSRGRRGCTRSRAFRA